MDTLYRSERPAKMTPRHNTESSMEVKKNPSATVKRSLEVANILVLESIICKSWNRQGVQSRTKGRKLLLSKKKNC